MNMALMHLCIAVAFLALYELDIISINIIIIIVI